MVRASQQQSTNQTKFKCRQLKRSRRSNTHTHTRSRIRQNHVIRIDRADYLLIGHYDALVDMDDCQVYLFDDMNSEFHFQPNPLNCKSCGVYSYELNCLTIDLYSEKQNSSNVAKSTRIIRVICLSFIYCSGRILRAASCNAHNSTNSVCMCMRLSPRYNYSEYEYCFSGVVHNNHSPSRLAIAMSHRNVSSKFLHVPYYVSNYHLIYRNDNMILYIWHECVSVSALRACVSYIFSSV